MKIVRLHHVAFAHVTDETSSALEHLLELRPQPVEAGDGFIERMYPLGDGGTCLQILEATGEGVVQKFVDRRGPGLHHLALQVADIEEALLELKASGADLIDSQPRPGGGDTRIAFIHPSVFSGLLVELVEDSTQPDV